MSVLLEHDNSQKARRAIIVTSVVTIVLHYAQLGSNEIDFFGLKIAVHKENISLFLKLALGYLLYIYTIFELGASYEDRVTRLAKRLKAELDRDIEEMDVPDTDAHSISLKKAEVEERFKMDELKRLTQLSFYMKIFSEYFPVYAFSLLAFTGLHELFLGDQIVFQNPDFATGVVEGAGVDAASAEAAYESN